MSERNYLITDAAKQVNVENHVLRYWEGELGLQIHRNEIGHRYYTNEDIQRFKRIKQLKDQGMQLRAIRTILDNKEKIMKLGEVQETSFTVQTAVDGRDYEMAQRTEQPKNEVEVVTKGNSLTDDKKLRLQQLLKQLVGEAVKDSTKEIMEVAKKEILQELQEQFQNQEEKENQREEERRKREEEHFKNIDALLRQKNQRKKHSIF